ncbi:type-F conjugative transfer system protein TraW [Vibrio sp. THAF190c]|uniref:type-F conjugative transfer system protein TraW n=1 Tax=Vibrio sp. THAF190c TaxID=2587865 RepID=UPI001267A5A6|nr:type-F conjugative transfer system protein TraW [Vibrio sp. THAF190c]QFT13612.1 hypothetical protein FIV04_27015 [Vibrio sp. THAF190c]
MRHHSRLALCLFTALLSSSLAAKDIGRVGPTFPIGEVDMLSWIETRLKQFEKNGKLAQMQHEFSEQVKKSVETPPPLPLMPTTNPKTYLVDPSIVVPKDLTDAQGRVFAKAGTRVNPFDTETWPTEARLPKFEYRKALVFFDARDARQLTFVEEFKHEKPLLYVLTGGSPNQVAKRLNQRIYFDQQGTLSEKLRIRAVPSLAEQSGKAWRVQEFDVQHLFPREE